MSLTDRTNETIRLSLHRPVVDDFPPYAPVHPAVLDVDADGDSSFDPNNWVHIALTDDVHDADRIKLTYDEAAQLHDRLGRIIYGDGRHVFVMGEGEWVRCTPAFLATTGGCPAGARRATEEENNHEHWVMAAVERTIRAEHQRIQDDLLSIAGVHLDLTQGEAVELGLEIAYQVSPWDGLRRYRGILQHGEWRIDHYPSWGAIRKEGAPQR